MRFMKLILKFDSLKTGLEIPYDHQYQVYAGLLNCIKMSNPELAASLHRSHAAPRYVMSQIMGSGRKLFSDTGFSSGRYVLLLNGREPSLLKEIAEAVESAKSLQIGELNLPFYSYDLIPLSAPGIPTEFITKSPVVIQEGNRYLRAGDDEFVEELKNNILRKTSAINPSYNASRIRYLRLIDNRNKLCTVAGGKIPCSIVRFVIDAGPEVIETIIVNGLGSKNQIGFGYVETCR